MNTIRFKILYQLQVDKWRSVPLSRRCSQYFFQELTAFYFHVQTDIVLRRHLAEAIAMCSKWGNNAKRFSEEGAVKPMVEYLASHDIIVQRSAMRALEQLGKNPDSCITMHRSGVVKVTLPSSRYQLSLPIAIRIF